MNPTSDLINLSRALNIRRDFYLVDLRRYFNNDGISFDLLKCDGDFDGKGSTYPAEELPPSNSIVYVSDVPFYFPSKEDGHANNFVLSGQSITFECGRYQSLHVLGAVDGQHGEVYEEEITVSFEDGVYEPVYLGLSNWLLSPKYNERIAFQCSHLHFPDDGQETIFNKNVPSISEYLVSKENRYETVPFFEINDIEDVKKGYWKPRIFMQKKALKFEKPIIGFTFMDNLNFHIFAMTLEKKISNG